MKKKIDDLSFSVSKKATNKYSTSFSLGIRALSADIRPAIYSIYGFVRLADEIVDSFHGFDKSGLMASLRAEVFAAINQGISLNPILHSFQKTVNQYQIDSALIDIFLKSMEMDLLRKEYDSDKYKEYILDSAESIGLMCLQVFVHGNKAEYEQLKPYAMKLGSAFQKVNFLRDIKDDYHVLGRTYFPNVDFSSFDSVIKTQIEQETESGFRASLDGIKKLPASAKFGIFLAYTYYFVLFKKVKNMQPETLKARRVRINNGHKLSLMLSSYFQFTFIGV